MPRSPELLLHRESLDGVPPPPLEFGYLVRTGRPGDEMAWLDLADGRRLLGLSAKDFVRRILEAPDFDPRGLVFVTIGSRPAGIALGTRPRPGSGVGRLHLFAVKQPYRGRGIGKYLVWRVLEYLKSAGCTSCEVRLKRSQNEARFLLQSLGFARADTTSGAEKERTWKDRKQTLRGRT